MAALDAHVTGAPAITIQLEDKRTVLKLVFATKLPYDRNEGFRTAQYALPFSLLEDLRQGQYEMVGLVGLEPTTKGL